MNKNELERKIEYQIWKKNKQKEKIRIELKHYESIVETLHYLKKEQTRLNENE